MIVGVDQARKHEKPFKIQGFRGTGRGRRARSIKRAYPAAVNAEIESFALVGVQSHLCAGQRHGFCHTPIQTAGTFDTS